VVQLFILRRVNALPTMQATAVAHRPVRRASSLVERSRAARGASPLHLAPVRHREAQHSASHGKLPARGVTCRVTCPLPEKVRATDLLCELPLHLAAARRGLCVQTVDSRLGAWTLAQSPPFSLESRPPESPLHLAWRPDQSPRHWTRVVAWGRSRGASRNSAVSSPACSVRERRSAPPSR